MFILLVILILLVAILLCVAVLLQSGKGGGLAGIASGGQATQILGARQAPDFLEKATWVLGSALIALCFLAPFTISDESTRSILQERIDQAPAEAPGVLPVTPGTPGPEVPGETPGAPVAPQPTPEGAPAPLNE